MFFPERIISIASSDRVLEVGPGSNPHHRSDVLLEKKFETQQEYEAQFGHEEKLISDKKIVFYEGDKFPFSDNEFDYVICSHVLEHVEDPELFLNEIFRVARKGYFEYPLIYYDYLYNFNVHLNFLKFDGKTLYYKKKSDTSLNEFLPIQSFFYESLKMGHVKLINDLLPFMMEGFEWHHPFETRKAVTVDELVLKNFSVPAPPVTPERSASALQLLKQLLKKTIKG